MEMLIDGMPLITEFTLGYKNQYASFLNKAKKRFEELQERAKVVVLSSHDNNVILKTCNKVLWLEGGKPKMIGDPEEVLNKYMDSVV